MRLPVLLFFIGACLPNINFSQSPFKLLHAIKSERFYTFEGNIDGKYPITMHLEQTGDLCGEADHPRWKPRVLAGWYEYTNVRRKIPLIGHIQQGDPTPEIRLYVPIQLKDSLVETNCMPASYAYQELFVTTGSADFTSMEWKTDKMESLLPVSLKMTHDLTWKTQTSISLCWHDVIVNEINLTEKTGVEYIQWIKPLSIKSVDGTVYAFVEFGHMSKPGGTGHGYCGAGIEQYIALLKYNRSFELMAIEHHQVHSCYKDIPEGTYIYDIEKPQNGIVVND